VSESATFVIDARLIGQQARPIVRQLRKAGLVPKVEWSYVGQVPTGTIIAIKPEGGLVPGTVVTVTVAAPESD
jgi:PASTA domain